MKTIFFIFIFLSASTFSNAQLKNKSSIQGNKTPNFSTSVSMGAMFGNAFSGTYIAPSFTQQLNSKLSLEYGGVFSRNTSNGFAIDNYGYAHSIPSSSNLFFVNGSYKVSSRLTLHSQIVVDQSAYTGFNQEMNNFTSNMVNMGFEYKFSDSFRVQAEIGMQQGKYPYSNIINPYVTNSFGQHGISPFYSSLIDY